MKVFVEVVALFLLVATFTAGQDGIPLAVPLSDASSPVVLQEPPPVTPDTFRRVPWEVEDESERENTQTLEEEEEEIQKPEVVKDPKEAESRVVETTDVALSIVEDPAVALGEELGAIGDVEISDAELEEVNVSDPREGFCSKSELDNITDFFSKNEESCEAYKCVTDKTRKFFESLLINYNRLWDEGGDRKVNGIASLLAACTCRCDMMRCEVDFVKRTASSSCISATIDYCEKQNTLFVDRCDKAAQDYLDSINEVAPDALWTKPCANACSRGFDPVDGLTLTDEGAFLVGTPPSSVRVDEEAVLEESKPQLAPIGEQTDVSQLIDDNIQTTKKDDNHANGRQSGLWWKVMFGCIFMALVGGEL